MLYNSHISCTTVGFFFGIFTKLCTHHHAVRTFSSPSPARKLRAHQQSRSIPPSPRFLLSTHPLSVSMDLPLLDK